MKAPLRQELDSQIKMRIHKRMHKVFHHINIIHHTILHIGELVVIIAIGWGSLLFANYSTSYEMFHRENMSEVNKYLQIAEKNGKPTEEKLISTRSIDSKVNNTFSAGYCTYGAARISPEFFPYSEDKTSQERTWGGNAIDRCENAEKAGFNIGSSAKKGALIIYNPGNGISSLGHVGKVIFYNNRTNYIIIRDMNRVAKSIMSDHWENLKTANIKCFIYPKTENDISEKNQTETIKVETGTINNNQEVNTGIVNTTIGTTTTDTTKEETINTEENQTETINDEAPIEVHSTANQEPEKDTVVEETISNEKKISLDIQGISDISKHFMDQYDLTVSKTSTNNLKIGDIITLTLSVKEKTTNTFYQGILPFSINILTSNNNISTSTSRIQMIQGDEFTISIKVLEAGDSSVVLILDETRIAQFSIKTN